MLFLHLLHQNNVLYLFLAFYFSNKLIKQNMEILKDIFAQRIKDFKALISSSEETYRRGVFENNFKKINDHNADRTQTFKMGLNQFSILLNNNSQPLI
jgi:hypothetical protein